MASVFKEEQPWVRAESREGLGAATETKGRMKGSECVNNFFHLNANLSLKKSTRDSIMVLQRRKTYLGTKGTY